MGLVVTSAGGKKQHGKTMSKQNNIFISCPTDIEMGRICSLLSNDEESRNLYVDTLRLVGNNPRLCERSRLPCLGAIETELDGLDLKVLDPGWVRSEMRAIKNKEGQIHNLFKMIPVSTDKTGEFLSFREWDSGYWSDAIEDMVFARLLQRLVDKHSVFDLLPWANTENQALTGYVLQHFIHELVKEQSIIAATALMRIRWVKRQGRYIAEMLVDEWSDGFFGPVPNVVRGWDVARAGTGCYFRPSSCGQVLYDAVIIPSDQTQMIDVIQVTVGARHEFKIKGFTNLFRLRPSRVRGNKPDFRLLVIRAARCSDEAQYMRHTQQRRTMGCAPSSNFLATARTLVL
jgi:hypothetical protein